MFISLAYAADEATTTASTTDTGSLLMSTLPILLIFLVFYFIVLRPQTARFQEHRKLVEGLQKGDKVVTGGGIVATVVRLQGDDEVVLKISDGVEVVAVRPTIMMLRDSPSSSKKKAQG